MRGLSDRARRQLDHLTDAFNLRECDLISYILEGLPLDHAHSLVRQGMIPKSPKARPSKYVRRVETSSMRVRQSKYGFADMEIGVRHKVACDSTTSLDYPIQAARRYALRMGLEFWYERLPAEHAVRVCFMRRA